MKVLIVDDDVYVLKGLKALIPWADLNVEIVGEARNGEEAFQIAIEKNPDIIITDIKMPVMDGLELCKKIHELTIDTSIILLSAYEDFDYALSAMKYGVKTYIIKPVDREKINRLIDEIVTIQRKHDEKLVLYKNLFNDEFEKDLFNALNNGNRAYIEEFFMVELSRKENQCLKSKEFYLRLVEMLFTYFRNVGVNPEPIIDSMDGAIQELYSMKTVENMGSYVEQLYFDVLQFTSQKKDSRAEHVVEYVKDYISRCYGDPNLSVSGIADKIKLSPAYLSAVFRQITGINIISHIKSQRFAKACELLKDPSISINTVSVLSGFQNQHYFTKSFKKQTKMTPSEYRNLTLCKCNKEGNGVDN